MKRSIAISFLLCFALLTLTDLLSSYIIRDWMIPSMSQPDLSMDEQTRNSEFWIGITSVFTFFKGGVVIWSLFVFGSLAPGARKGQSTLLAVVAIGSALMAAELAFGSRKLLIADLIFFGIATGLWNLTPNILKILSEHKNTGDK